MTSESSILHTAFAGHRCVARGSLGEIGAVLARLPADGPPVLVFRDTDGALVDAPPSPAQAAVLHRHAKAGASPPVAAAPPAAPAPAPAVGRPRLGVVAREVTLLPRHWEWLGVQPGGASAALRRLVDEARRAHAARDDQRAATERAYRFMSAIASDLPGFEEASRALFAHDRAGFESHTASWPIDVRSFLARLGQGAWAGAPASEEAR